MSGAEREKDTVETYISEVGMYAAEEHSFTGFVYDCREVNVSDIRAVSSTSEITRRIQCTEWIGTTQPYLIAPSRELDPSDILYIECSVKCFGTCVQIWSRLDHIRFLILEESLYIKICRCIRSEEVDSS